MNQITIMKCLLNQGVSDIYKQKKQSKQNNGWKEKQWNMFFSIWSLSSLCCS